MTEKNNSFKSIQFRTIGNEDIGSLVALEVGDQIPFDVKRVYYIYGTKKNIERGFHAHIKLKQLIVVLNGSCTFNLDDGENHTTIELSKPNEGLLINGLIWREMKKISEDCVIMVIASELYDESDYIREYREFKKLTKRR